MTITYCTCGQCGPMPTDIESFCCHELAMCNIDIAKGKMVFIYSLLKRLVPKTTATYQRNIEQIYQLILIFSWIHTTPPKSIPIEL